jgi:hypothetical protein
VRLTYPKKNFSLLAYSEQLVIQDKKSVARVPSRKTKKKL